MGTHTSALNDQAIPTARCISWSAQAAALTAVAVALEQLAGARHQFGRFRIDWFRGQWRLRRSSLREPCFIGSGWLPAGRSVVERAAIMRCADSRSRASAADLLRSCSNSAVAAFAACLSRSASSVALLDCATSVSRSRRAVASSRVSSATRSRSCNKDCRRSCSARKYMPTHTATTRLAAIEKAANRFRAREARFGSTAAASILAVTAVSGGPRNEML